MKHEIRISKHETNSKFKSGRMIETAHPFPSFLFGIMHLTKGRSIPSIYCGYKGLSHEA
jgi:hypothetical protein